MRLELLSYRVRRELFLFHRKVPENEKKSQLPDKKKTPHFHKSAIIQTKLEKTNQSEAGMMGRYYRLSKEITEAEADEILRELREKENLKSVELSEDRKRMKVETEDGEYASVMGAAVNICSRIARGCELSFEGFCIL